MKHLNMCGLAEGMTVSGHSRTGRFNIVPPNVLLTERLGLSIQTSCTSDRSDQRDGGNGDSGSRPSKANEVPRNQRKPNARRKRRNGLLGGLLGNRKNQLLSGFSAKFLCDDPL